MAKVNGPELTKYLDKKLSLKLNGRRTVVGVLRGFDQFMNVVLEESEEVLSDSQSESIGSCVIRGNSILLIECLEKLGGKPNIVHNNNASTNNVNNNENVA